MMMMDLSAVMLQWMTCICVPVGKCFLLFVLFRSFSFVCSCSFVCSFVRSHSFSSFVLIRSPYDIGSVSIPSHHFSSCSFFTCVSLISEMLS